jgi:LVIVD repeat
VDQHGHDEVDETEGTVCRTVLTQDITCAGQVGCTYAAGEQTCHDHGEGTQFCAGGFAWCTDHGNGDSTCEPRAAGELEGATPNTYCEPAQRVRIWRQLELHVVDLSDPAAPTLVDPILLPPEHHALSAHAHGSDLYVSTKVPVAVPGDLRPHAAHYLTRIDLSEPAQPAVAPAVSVPGELIAVQGDSLLMRDAVWGQQFVETALVQIRIAGGHALLQRYHRFAGRSVGNVVSDDSGLVAAKHGQVWGRPWYHALGAFDDKLSLMHMGPATSPPGAGVPGFDVLSEKAVEHVPEPFLLAEHRLFLRNYDGLQIIDVSDPAAPVPMAFFQANGALSNPLCENGELLVAAGRWGILQIDLDTDNLLDAAP